MNTPASVPHAVGVIGLGRMGRPMAENLARKGFATFAYDVNATAMGALVDRGVIARGSAREVVAQAEMVVLSLPTQEVLEELVLGPGGFVEAEIAGKIIIDTTTTTPEIAKRLAGALASRGCAFLDSPVTGGAAGAQAATLSIMIGGDAAAVAAARPVYEALGTNVVHIGSSGHGQIAKMVNQMLMAAIYTSVAESFAFAAQQGADVAKIFQAVENGGGRSKVLSDIKPYLLGGTPRTNGNLAQHGKDIDYVMQQANAQKIFLPIASAVHEFYNLSRTLGFGQNSSHDMWAVWEKLLGIDFTATIRNEQTPAMGKGA